MPRLPDLKNLLNRDVDGLIRVLQRFGIEPDVAAIERDAGRAFERLEELIAEGLEPDEATWELIEGQIEKQVAQTLRQQVKDVIRSYQLSKLEASGADLFAWVTVGDANVCASCEPRHGEVETLAVWYSEGTPGSGVLICASECRCVLVAVFEE